MDVETIFNLHGFDLEDMEPDDWDKYTKLIDDIQAKYNKDIIEHIDIVERRDNTIKILCQSIERIGTDNKD